MTCPNDWVCTTCKQAGHKRDTCPLIEVETGDGDPQEEIDDTCTPGEKDTEVLPESESEHTPEQSEEESLHEDRDLPVMEQDEAGALTEGESSKQMEAPGKAKAQRHPKKPTGSSDRVRCCPDSTQSLQTQHKNTTLS